MIEVFKTNVNNVTEASMLLDVIHKRFACYSANFDLSDCDNILRVKSVTGIVEPELLIELLKDHGFQAEVLPDDFTVSPHKN